jgi:curved DNA-binding protein CbpA
MEEREVPDYYEILGLGPQAFIGEIKQAFRGLAKLYHPDKQAPRKCTDAEEFRKMCVLFYHRLSKSVGRKLIAYIYHRSEQHKKHSATKPNDKNTTIVIQ